MNWKRVEHVAVSTGVTIVGFGFMITAGLLHRIDCLMVGVQCMMVAALWEISWKLSELRKDSK